MKTSIHDDCLPVLKALACQTRLDILRLLSEKPMNQQELAAKLGISPAITSGHIRQLCEAGLVFTDGGETGRGRQKICYVAESEVNLSLTKAEDEKMVRYAMPIGLYSRHRVSPSCGMAAENRVIGGFDDEMVFLDPARTEAELIWFSSGYLEYVIPIGQSDQQIQKLTVSLEMASEYPGYRTNWPSEITFTVNNTPIGKWICPGNFGDRRGQYTPAWWALYKSQYGLLKTITVDDSGSYIDGEKMSDVTVRDLNLTGSRFYLRFSVDRDAHPAGGLTLFGKAFGDYNQDIVITTYYE